MPTPISSNDSHRLVWLIISALFVITSGVSGALWGSLQGRVSRVERTTVQSSERLARVETLLEGIDKRQERMAKQVDSLLTNGR